MKSKDFVELGRGMSSHGNETPSVAHLDGREGRSAGLRMDGMKAKKI